jgi:uncharacterized lipoprotein YddW (UPF0748 family)
MVKAVYDMIQATKPYVRFGISPAGVTCTDATHASKYGVDRCMSGSDWQYNGIFSDPLAWLSSKTIDFISPQVYWTIGYSSADYSVITPWWSKVANKFGRHVYISHSISSLTAKSSAPGLSAVESTIRKASGPNSSSYSEFANEVEMNRTENLQNAPGSIYYSCRYLYNLSATESFAHYLHRTVYTRPALPPVMTWKAGVTTLALSRTCRRSLTHSLGTDTTTCATQSMQCPTTLHSQHSTRTALISSL